MKSNHISSEKIANLELRIGHKFGTHERLIRALTHTSAVRSPGDASHYERMEFLGDRVLGFCIAELLFTSFPTAREGELSVRLNALVSGSTCSDIADEIGLHEFIYAGADLKQLASKRMRSVRADVVESLIAAIYLDAGLEAARAFVTKFWMERIHSVGAATRDSKTALQEWAHSQGHSTPVYRVTNRSGPDHDPMFVVEVVVKGAEGSSGAGRSKRSAEQQAAETMLINQGAWIQSPDGTIQETKF